MTTVSSVLWAVEYWLLPTSVRSRVSISLLGYWLDIARALYHREDVWFILIGQSGNSSVGSRTWHISARYSLVWVWTCRAAWWLQPSHCIATLTQWIYSRSGSTRIGSLCFLIIQILRLHLKILIGWAMLIFCSVWPLCNILVVLLVYRLTSLLLSLIEWLLLALGLVLFNDFRVAFI